MCVFLFCLFLWGGLLLFGVGWLFVALGLGFFLLLFS